MKQEVMASLSSLTGECRGIWMDTEVLKRSTDRGGSWTEAADIVALPKEMEQEPSHNG